MDASLSPSRGLVSTLPGQRTRGNLRTVSLGAGLKSRTWPINHVSNYPCDDCKLEVSATAWLKVEKTGSFDCEYSARHLES